MAKKKNIDNLIDLIVRDSHTYLANWKQLQRDIIALDRDRYRGFDAEEIREDSIFREKERRLLIQQMDIHPMVNSTKLIKELSIAKKNMQDTDIQPSLFDIAGDQLLKEAGLLGVK